ncbi:MAG TPA: alkaline phosphatase family protein [Candidatus Brocadiia bacterium]|nr:alkaline phosphatase family protein [Candidatus Brocadiales bacterium]
MRKILYIVLDGLSDGEIGYKELGGKTPLEAAHTPNMDYLAGIGQTGLMYTVGKGIAPESDIAVMSILGYDVKKYYTGRGPLECHASGLKVNDGDLAFRANFATRGSGRGIRDRRCGRNLSDKEAALLCKEINSRVKLDSVPATFEFKNTVGHRAVLVIRSKSGKLSGNVTNTDPAYAKEGSLGVSREEGTYRNEIEYCKPVETQNIASLRAALLTNEFMLKSCEALDESKINQKRIKNGLLPANLILLRDAGDRLPRLPSIEKKFNLSFGCFVEMPVEEGIALLTGMDIVPLPVPTKNLKKDYSLRADLTLRHIKNYDGLYVHIKGPDLPGHDGDVRGKKAVIEAIDSHYIGSILEKIDLKDTIITITADHSTPCRLKSHSDDPVPVLICGGGVKGHGQTSLSMPPYLFSERACKKGVLGRLLGTQLLPLLIKLATKL